MKLEEMEVLQRCHDLLKDQSDDVKIRTLQWLSSKFNMGQTTLTLSSQAAFASAAAPATSSAPAPKSSAAPAPAPAKTSKAASASGGMKSFKSFEDLFKAAKPSSDSEKALAAAVYLQLYKDEDELTSAQVQKELKNIGQRVSNITQAISALVKKKLMIQLGKEGNSKQARKKYKATLEGIKMITSGVEK
ncbi:MAG TPA: hypothetical protein PKC76_16790 [Saprospiraceae bacterium]|nr:hypothetical protein [Saprospiraceae bacterium]HMP25791.1 hypothetical protein [Saprospiraceae bacterium]